MSEHNHTAPPTSAGFWQRLGLWMGIGGAFVCTGMGIYTYYRYRTRGSPTRPPPPDPNLLSALESVAARRRRKRVGETPKLKASLPPSDPQRIPSFNLPANVNSNIHTNHAHSSTANAPVDNHTSIITPPHPQSHSHSHSHTHLPLPSPSPSAFSLDFASSPHTPLLTRARQKQHHLSANTLQNQENTLIASDTASARTSADIHTHSVDTGSHIDPDIDLKADTNPHNASHTDSHTDADNDTSTDTPSDPAPITVSIPLVPVPPTVPVPERIHVESDTALQAVLSNQVRNAVGHLRGRSNVIIQLFLFSLLVLCALLLFTDLRLALPVLPSCLLAFRFVINTVDSTAGPAITSDINLDPVNNRRNSNNNNNNNNHNGILNNNNAVTSRDSRSSDNTAVRRALMFGSMPNHSAAHNGNTRNAHKDDSTAGSAPPASNGMDFRERSVSAPIDDRISPTDMFHSNNNSMDIINIPPTLSSTTPSISDPSLPINYNNHSSSINNPEYIPSPLSHSTSTPVLTPISISPASSHLHIADTMDTPRIDDMVSNGNVSSNSGTNLLNHHESGAAESRSDTPPHTHTHIEYNKDKEFFSVGLELYHRIQYTGTATATVQPLNFLYKHPWQHVVQTFLSNNEIKDMKKTPNSSSNRKNKIHKNGGVESDEEDGGVTSIVRFSSTDMDADTDSKTTNHNNTINTINVPKFISPSKKSTLPLNLLASFASHANHAQSTNADAKFLSPAKHSHSQQSLASLLHTQSLEYETVEQYVHEQCTYTRRHVRVRVKLPSLLRKLFSVTSNNGECDIMIEERSKIDPIKKILRVQSYNLQYKKFVLIYDERTYMSHPDNPATTYYASKAHILTTPACGLVRSTLHKYAGEIYACYAQQYMLALAQMIALKYHTLPSSAGNSRSNSDVNIAQRGHSNSQSSIHLSDTNANANHHHNNNHNSNASHMPRNIIPHSSTTINGNKYKNVNTNNKH